MNELQQVLLVFAVIVIAVLYFLSKKRSQAKSKTDTSKPSAETPKNAPAEEVSEPSISKQQASEALNNLGEEHQPLSAQTQSRLTLEQSATVTEQLEQPQIPEGQASLPFGDEFEIKQPELEAHPDEALSIEETAIDNKGPKHHILEVEELLSIEEAGMPMDREPTVNFGIPEEEKGRSPGITQGEKTEPQIFALLVLSTGGSAQEFTMDAVNQALLGVGLRYSSKNIYATTDSKGNEIIRVANILEPGTFPSENLASHATPGIALILQLPTTVRAPAAMHDLIMMARKVSQRLNGRLYNMERHLIKESDLQAMRDAAVEYESKPL